MLWTCGIKWGLRDDHWDWKDRSHWTLVRVGRHKLGGHRGLSGVAERKWEVFCISKGVG